MRKAGLLVPAAVLAALVAGQARAEIIGRASVVDGDTIEIHGRRIRLFGIDAPEATQTCGRDNVRWRCGRQATRALDERIAGRPVVCTIRGKDVYGRGLGVCEVDGDSLNGWLVSQGWALAFRKYSDDYLPQENFAKAAKKGVWRGQFIVPWEVRADQREADTEQQPQQLASANDCRIKGDISPNGDRIYHTPNSPWYERTTIDPGRGERWFCSTEEARSAGWRAPKR